MNGGSSSAASPRGSPPEGPRRGVGPETARMQPWNHFLIIPYKWVLKRAVGALVERSQEQFS